jgi:hypothetical protein
MQARHLQLTVIKELDQKDMSKPPIGPFERPLQKR